MALAGTRKAEFWDDPNIERAENVLWAWADELAERGAGGVRIKAQVLGESRGGGGGSSHVPVSFAYELVESILKPRGLLCRSLMAHLYNPSRGDGELRQKGSHHTFEDTALDAVLASLGVSENARVRLLESVEKRTLREICRRQGGLGR